MKVHEIFLTEEELYEISLKHAVAAGALGLSMMGSPNNTQQEAPPQRQQRAHLKLFTVQGLYVGKEKGGRFWLLWWIDWKFLSAQ